MRKRNIILRRIKNNSACEHYLNRLIVDRTNTCESCIYCVRIDGISYCKNEDSKYEKKVL